LGSRRKLDGSCKNKWG